MTKTKTKAASSSSTPSKAKAKPKPKPKPQTATTAAAPKKARPAKASARVATATVRWPAPTESADITRQDVEKAQRAWGDALVQISQTFDDQGLKAATALAEQVLDAAYGYAQGPVLFKPTLAAAPQTFRTTREGALSYFVGGNTGFAGDGGFGLKHWRKVDIQNAAIHLHGNLALSMGNVIFTDRDGHVTTVDKTWGYIRDADGAVRIVLHHSSLPYVPAPAPTPASTAPVKSKAKSKS